VKAVDEAECIAAEAWEPGTLDCLRLGWECWTFGTLLMLAMGWGFVFRGMGRLCKR